MIDSIVAFVLVFGAIVFFHELGHYGTAKLFGVGVYEFAVGIGPPLISRTWRGTRYSVRLLPLGGFCRLAGMEPAEDERTGLQPTDRRHFRSRPLWQRTVVIAAGPAMNFVQAIVLLALLATVTIPVQVVGLEPGAPAEQAGFRTGDAIQAINGEKVFHTAEVNRHITESGGQSVEITVLREGESIPLTVRPEVRPDGTTLIGVQIIEGTEGVPWWQALPQGIRRTWEMTAGLVLGIWAMITGAVATDLSGPLGIFRIVGESAQAGWLYLLNLAALLNVNLGLLNLLPIPVLDGGWLLFLGLEGLRGKPLAPEQQGLAQLIGFGFIMALVLFATYQDLLRYFPFLE